MSDFDPCDRCGELPGIDYYVTGRDDDGSDVEAVAEQFTRDHLSRLVGVEDDHAPNADDAPWWAR